MIRNLCLIAAATTLAACVPAPTPGNTSSEGVSSESSSAAISHSSQSSVAPTTSSSVAMSSSSSSGNTGAGVIFSENFESGTNGQLPSGWETFTGYVPNQSNAAQYLSVDSSRAHSGSKSLHVKGDSNGPQQIVKKLPGNIDQLYIRAWFYMSVSMGNMSSDNHEHIMGTKRVESDPNRPFTADNEIRIGQGKGHLGYNLPGISDAISPKYEEWGTGPTTPANQWFCVEAEFDKTPSYDQLYMNVNGQEVNAVTDASNWHAPVGANWMDGLLGYAFFGWHSFSGRANNMWIDDVVVSTQPIGCN